eukprot:8625809-Lingulodinium_polyedra.AAC.1
MGVEHSYSWTFSGNDRRAKARKNLGRLRGNPLDLIYLSIKNHGWTGLPAAKDRQGLGLALEDPAPQVASDQELQDDAKEFNGWRLS